MRSTPIIVLDIETTGLSAYASNITEIAAIKVVNEKEIDSFHTLVNPQEPIPPFITHLTGITNEMVQSAPPIQDVLLPLKKFLGNNPIIAHNASFDYNFISHNLYKHHGEELTNPKLCTAKLARRVHGELPSKRLGALCEFYGITNKRAHRAMGDTKATVELYYRLLAELEEHDISSPEDIIHFEHMTRARAEELLQKNSTTKK